MERCISEEKEGWQFLFLLNTLSEMNSVSWDIPGIPDIPSIPEFFEGRSIFLTGGSGFIGKVVIEKLLRSAPGIEKIYILLREKKGKSPKARVKDITDQPLFDVLKKQNAAALEKIVPINGDVSKIGLGLHDEDKNTITNNVSVIYNIAACVRFDDPLKNAVIQNVRSTREIIRLCEDIQNMAVFVQVSTAYCNCDQSVIEEKLYPARTSWREVIELAEKGDDNTLQYLTEKYIYPLPNTYTFTKSLAEHVVNDLCRGKFPTVIIRPSIVISAVGEPVPGWIDNFNGPFALFIATGVGFAKAFYGMKDHIMDHVCVDNFVKSLIIATWEKATISKKKEDISIYNSCSEVEVSFEAYFGFGYRAARKCPYEKKVWAEWEAPFISNNVYIFFLLTILLHILPALVIDGLIRLFKGEPMALKIQRKIYIANISLYYFLSKNVAFNTENYNNLPQKLLEEDKSQFGHLTVDLETYSYIVLRGLKQFLLNENPIVSERTIFIDKCWSVVDKVVKFIGRVLVLYYLYCKRQYALDLLERFVIYFQSLS